MKMNKLFNISEILRKIKSKGLSLCMAVAFIASVFCASSFAAGVEYYPGRLLVKPKPGVELTSLQKFNKTMGVTLAKPLAVGHSQWSIVHFSPTDDVFAKAREYLKSGLILYAEPDYIMYTQKVPNDPDFADLDKTYSFRVTDAIGAWDKVNQSPDVVVAVVDTGIRTTHRDLKDNLWTAPDGSHGICYRDGVESTDVTDDSAHGTHVSGTVGARGNNNEGTAGVSWNVQIMACKGLFGKQGQGATSDIIAGCRFARVNGAKVINMSLGGGSRQQAFVEELQAAKEAGIIVVVAAGNEGSNNDNVPVYPANYAFERDRNGNLILDNMIVVGSSTSSDSISDFSNYGKETVHLFAPGSNIYSCWNTGDTAYEYDSGTSMAAPFVSGVVALCKAAYPAETYQQTLTRIFMSVDTNPAMTKKSIYGGRINVARAVAATLTPEGFRFAIYQNRAIILGYEGTGANPVIPDTIQGYPVVTIADAAFAGNSKIAGMVISDSVISFGDGVFANCTNLTSVVFGSGMTSVGSKTFQGCTKLAEINIPANITDIPSDFTYGCPALMRINVAADNPSYSSDSGILLSKDGADLVRYPQGRTDLFIPGTVQTIGDSAFAYASLTSVVLPEKVRRVDRNAFCYCTNLTTVKFGEELTSVGIYAFYGCTALKSLYFDGPPPTVMELTFLTTSPTVYYTSQYRQSWEAALVDGKWYGLTVEAPPVLSYSVRKAADGESVLVLEYAGTLYSSEDGANWSKVEGAGDTTYEVSEPTGPRFYKVFSK
mgnify:CR=1 FL=1